MAPIAIALNERLAGLNALFGLREPRRRDAQSHKGEWLYRRARSSSADKLSTASAMDDSTAGRSARAARDRSSSAS
jgi:hypothetical protein